MSKTYVRPHQRKIRVTRKGYYRKGFYIHRNGKRIYIPPTYIPPSTYYIPDRGAPGKGKQVIPPLKKGKMNRIAKKMGYERVTDIPDTKLKEYAKRLVNAYGAKRAFGMTHAQVVLRKRTQPQHRKKFEKIEHHIAEMYGHRLTPKSAIHAWESMSPAARAKAMPGGEI